MKSLALTKTSLPCEDKLSNCMFWPGFNTYQSGSCQESKMEAARIASEFSLEKLPVAVCNPENATPRWYNARFFVSAELVNQARCVAERANKELITKSKPTDTSRKLGSRISINAHSRSKVKGKRTLVFAPPIMCTGQSWQASYLSIC